jgi:hypothetical protein
MGLRVAMQRLSANLGGVDLSKFKLHAPLPDIPVNDARVSAVQSYIVIARREGTTVRQMAMRSAAAKHSWTLNAKPHGLPRKTEQRQSTEPFSSRSESTEKRYR